MVTLNKDITIGSTSWGTLVNSNWQTIEDSLNATSSRGVKDPCRAATTGNITLSGTQTIDGVACIASDRVLVRAQTAAAENGIYAVAAGAWARTTDADTAIELVPGTIVHVNEGTAFAGTLWRFTGSGAYILGTTAIFLKEIDGWCAIEFYRSVWSAGASPSYVEDKLSLGTFTDTSPLDPHVLNLGSVGSNRGAPYLTHAAGTVTIGNAGAGRYHVRAAVRLYQYDSGGPYLFNHLVSLVVNGVEQASFRKSANMASQCPAGDMGNFHLDGFVTLAVGDTIAVAWYMNGTADYMYLGNSNISFERVSP